MQTFKKNLVIHSIQRLFFKHKKTITMSPESKLLVLLSTRDIIACCVECFDENRTDICKLVIFHS